MKKYVIIDGYEGVFEGKAYNTETEAKARAYDAVKDNETKSGFPYVDEIDVPDSEHPYDKGSFG